MKIAIQGHKSRGHEVIQILESLGGKNGYDQLGSNERFVYFINNIGYIYSVTLQMCSNERKIYTLEEFEKEYPFKIGDKVKDCSDNEVGTILGFIDLSAFINVCNELMYIVDFEKSGHANMPVKELKPYKEMKEERNITLTLDKAKEWYNKGGELKEIALQAFTEKELYPLPRSWDEYCRKYKFVCLSTRHANISLKYDALIKLEQLRNCWWNGWEPEWNNCEKYVIKWDKNDLMVFTAKNIHAFLVFPTREMAVEFLKCFRSLIEQAGDLI